MLVSSDFFSSLVGTIEGSSWLGVSMVPSDLAASGDGCWQFWAELEATIIEDGVGLWVEEMLEGLAEVRLSKSSNAPDKGRIRELKDVTLREGFWDATDVCWPPIWFPVEGARSDCLLWLALEGRICLVV